VIPEHKIIVEYHGSFWHANPERQSNDWKNSFYSYEESLQKEKEKKRIAEEHGFSYYVVWDYQRNCKKTIELLLNIKQK
jgi:G:T-mismatch repair DNA endonuclease (very short patch repair protein)